MVSKTCVVCGAIFSAVSHQDVNKKLYNHGINRHQGELRRAAGRTESTTDPIWVADYISGKD